MTIRIRYAGLVLLMGILAGGEVSASTPARVRAAERARAQAGGARGSQPPPPAAGPAAQSDTVPTAELVNMLDTFAIVQAQTALSLSDDQYGSFVMRLRALQNTRRRTQRERNQILQDLRKLTGPRAEAPADEATLRERLKALREHDDRAAVEMAKAYDALDQTLTVQQQARYRIFEETIERRKLDLILRAKQRATPAATPPGGREGR